MQGSQTLGANADGTRCVPFGSFSERERLKGRHALVPSPIRATLREKPSILIRSKDQHLHWLVVPSAVDHPLGPHRWERAARLRKRRPCRGRVLRLGHRKRSRAAAKRRKTTVRRILIQAKLRAVKTHRGNTRYNVYIYIMYSNTQNNAASHKRKTHAHYKENTAKAKQLQCKPLDLFAMKETCAACGQFSLTSGMLWHPPQSQP